MLRFFCSDGTVLDMYVVISGDVSHKYDWAMERFENFIVKPGNDQKGLDSFDSLIRL